MRWRDEEVTRQMKQLDRAMFFIQVTVAAYRLGIHAWNSWCIVMLVIIPTGIHVRDTSTLPDTDSLPPQVHKGRDMSYDAYGFKALDCDKPEDVLTQSLPHGFSVKALDG